MWYPVLIIGFSLIILQWLVGSGDGCATPAQMEDHRIAGPSLLEQGTFWTDLFIATPVVAYILGNYELGFFHSQGLFFLVITIAITFFAVIWRRDMGRNFPNAYAHHGRTTIAGWIHFIFSASCLWVVLLFYCSKASRPIERDDLFLVSSGLTLLAIVGKFKFYPNWRPSPMDVWIGAIEIVYIWLATMIRLIRP